MNKIKEFFANLPAKLKVFFTKENLNKTFNPRIAEYKIFQNAYYWLVAPLVIIFIALLCGTIFQFSNKYDGFANVGVDFKGGTVLSVEMQGADMLGSKRSEHINMIYAVLEGNGVVPSGSPQDSSDTTLIIRYANSVNGQNYNTKERTQDMIAVNTAITREIERIFQIEYPTSTITANAEMINASSSAQSIRDAVLSVSIAVLAMLIYIAIRFDFFGGLTAIVAQVHDVIIMLCGVIIFRIPINATFVACMITIISYSINNTIVIFDRMRENLKPFKHKAGKIDYRFIVDSSVTQSMMRNIVATATTLIVVLILSMVGVPALAEFALPIIFGLLAGIYSSVFISPSLWGLIMQARQKKAATYTKEDDNKKAGKKKIAAKR